MTQLKPLGVSLFLVFAMQTSAGEAQVHVATAPDAGLAATAVDFLGADGATYFDELADSSTCSCPKFSCGKALHAGCSKTCAAPQVAQCKCATCDNYDRESTCQCVNP